MSAAGRATSLGPNGVVLDPSTIASLLIEAGATPDQATVLTAISGHEDPGHRLNALNDNPGTGDYSVGLFQVNYAGNLLAGRTASYGSPTKLAADPLAQAKAAVAISGGTGGTNFSPWTTYKSVSQADLESATQAVVAAENQLGKTGLLGIPSIAGRIQANGLTAPAGSADYTPSGGLVDPGSAWHSVLLNLDGILNNKPDGSGVNAAINLLNPVSDLRVIVARSGIVLGGLIVSVFGLLILTEAIAGKNGATVAAGVVPGGKFAAAALAPKEAATDHKASKRRATSESRREDRHQDDRRRADEKFQDRQSRSRYKSASKPKNEEPF